MILYIIIYTIIVVLLHTIIILNRRSNRLESLLGYCDVMKLKYSIFSCQLEIRTGFFVSSKLYLSLIGQFY